MVVKSDHQLIKLNSPLYHVVSKVFQEYGLLVFTMTCLGIVSIVMYTFQTKFKFQGTKPM